MTADSRLQVLQRAASELIAFEAGLAARLAEDRQVVQAHPEAGGRIERFMPMVQAHRDRLVTYLKGIGGDEPRGVASRSVSASGVSGTLRVMGVAFNDGAMRYVVLYEIALRLYEPALREMAPKHLKAYVDAAAAVQRLLPAVVAWELARSGLHCSCICPMCGLGACGCVAFGTQTLLGAWREASAAEAAVPGFGLQAPKPESELAKAGVRGGDTLLAVDGQGVRSIDEIQAAIRKHAVGEQVRLLVQRGSDAASELIVKHVSDYPKT